MSLSALLMTGLAAYLTVVIQIGVLGNWPLFGGQPHLIALGSIVFLVMHRPTLGLVWILLGGGLIDFLLPARFGITLLPLLIAYSVVAFMTRSTIDTASWWGSALMGLVLVALTQLPLAFYTQAWHQLGFDLLAAVIFILPISTTMAARISSRRYHVTV